MRCVTIGKHLLIYALSACVTLSVSPQALRQRLQRDIDAGLRQPDIVERSLARLPLYRELSTRKVDVSDLSPEQAAQEVLRLLE